MIDTEIVGDPVNIRAWASWLRTGLKAGLDDTSDSTVKARKVARDGWHGEGGEAYLAYNQKLVEATDTQEKRVGRGAKALGDLAGELTSAQGRMTALRTRATNGGLTVTGFVIEAPADVPAEVVEPGSPEEAAHNAAVDQVTLYDTLADDAVKVRNDYADWVDATMPAAVSDAEEDDAIRNLVTFIKAQYPDLVELTAVGLASLASLLKDKRAKFLRDSRRSGDPRKRARVKSPRGTQYADDLAKRSKFLDRLSKLFGKAGLPLAVGAGVYEGVTTGDWVKPVLTVGGGIAAGALVAAGLASLPVTLPAAAVTGIVVVGAGVASWGIGELYDKFEVKDKIDDFGGWSKDKLEDVGGAISGGWDKVTPW